MAKEEGLGKLFEDRRVALLVLFLVVIVGVAVVLSLTPRGGQGSDIYYSYVEGQRIAAGQDPYARILAGNMRENDKYATYFPLFYLLSALSQRLGLADYDRWIGFWRIAFLVFNVGAGCVLYWILYRRGAVWLAILSTLVWFLSRWNLEVSKASTLEYMPIFFVLLSLGLLERHYLAACLLLSVSLALKQVAIWVVPLYLIWAWRVAAPLDPKQRLKALLLAAASIASVTLLTALPFLLHDAEGFVRSIAFSVTRNAEGSLGAGSLDKLLGMTGLAARLPMLGLMAMLCAAFWRAELGMFRAAFLAMTVFIHFNSVLYLHYFPWVVALLPLALIEYQPAPWAEGVPSRAAVRYVTQPLAGLARAGGRSYALPALHERKRGAGPARAAQSELDPE